MQDGNDSVQGNEGQNEPDVSVGKEEVDISTGGGGEVGKDSRNLAMLCHVLGIFTGFIGALIIWLIKKDDDAFVADQGKEALNFQITVCLGYIVSSLLAVVGIGCILWGVIYIGNLILCVMAGLGASNGQKYRYPVNIRFLK